MKLSHGLAPVVSIAARCLIFPYAVLGAAPGAALGADTDPASGRTLDEVVVTGTRVPGRTALLTVDVDGESTADHGEVPAVGDVNAEGRLSRHAQAVVDVGAFAGDRSGEGLVDGDVDRAGNRTVFRTMHLFVEALLVALREKDLGHAERVALLARIMALARSQGATADAAVMEQMIRQQIRDGLDGCLIKNPEDIAELEHALDAMLAQDATSRVAWPHAWLSWHARPSRAATGRWSWTGPTPRATWPP